ncbi:NAD-dependent epimerase/dehydratase family protein [Blastococcus sp. SYSU DS0510]
MKVLVLGATGYIGSVLVERLVGAGHEVVALTRPGVDEPPAIASVGTVAGDLAEPEGLSAAVAPDIDAVVHVAPPTGVAAADIAAVEALLVPLRGTGRTFLYTSGLWVLGATGTHPADEDSPLDAIELVAHRPVIERLVLDAAETGVRGLVVRPAIAHGRGGGIPGLLVSTARDHGAGRFVGSADTRWPMVHVDDLAELFLLVLEQAPAGRLFHGVDEEAVPVPELAAAAARAAGLDGSAESWPVEDARAVLGAAFADALALSQSATGARAREELGWHPRRPGAVQELGAGSYAASRVG